MHFTSFVVIFLALFTSTLALPLVISQSALAARDLEQWDASLSSRQLLGAALRGVGKAAAKIPEKLGKQIGKEGAKNSGDTNGVDVQATAEKMGKNMEKMGKPQIGKCLEGMVTHMAKWGGYNGNWPCDKPDPKKAEEAKKLQDAKQKAFASTNKVDPKSAGAQMSAARAKVLGGKK